MFAIGLALSRAYDAAVQAGRDQDGGTLARLLGAAVIATYTDDESMVTGINSDGETISLPQSGIWISLPVGDNDKGASLRLLPLSGAQIADITNCTFGVGIAALCICHLSTRRFAAAHALHAWIGTQLTYNQIHNLLNLVTCEQEFSRGDTTAGWIEYRARTTAVNLGVISDVVLVASRSLTVVYVHGVNDYVQSFGTPHASVAEYAVADLLYRMLEKRAIDIENQDVADQVNQTMWLFRSADFVITSLVGMAFAGGAVYTASPAENANARRVVAVTLMRKFANLFSRWSASPNGYTPTLEHADRLQAAMVRTVTLEGGGATLESIEAGVGVIHEAANLFLCSGPFNREPLEPFIQIAGDLAKSRVARAFHEAIAELQPTQSWRFQQARVVARDARIRTIISERAGRDAAAYAERKYQQAVRIANQMASGTFDRATFDTDVMAERVRDATKLATSQGIARLPPVIAESTIALEPLTRAAPRRGALPADIISNVLDMLSTHTLGRDAPGAIRESVRIRADVRERTIARDRANRIEAASAAASSRPSRRRDVAASDDELESATKRMHM